MPVTQPNSALTQSSSSQQFAEYNGFSLAVNFTNVGNDYGDAPVSPYDYVVNKDLDYFKPYYHGTVDTPGEVGVLMPQFIIVSIYNAEPWLESKINQGHVRFKFRPQPQYGNYPFTPAGWDPATHATIADGLCIPVDDNYFGAGGGNPWSDEMFNQSVNGSGIPGNELLATQLHPGVRNSWNTTAKTWAKHHTFMSKTPAMPTLLSTSSGFNGTNDEPKYLDLQIQIWDNFNMSWGGIPTSNAWAQQFVSVNNDNKDQLYINEGYEDPPHKALYFFKADISNKGWLPAGDSLTHGNNIFTTAIDDFFIPALNGELNQSSPGSSCHIDDSRNYSFAGWAKSNCIKYDIGALDMGHNGRLGGSQSGGIVYTTGTGALTFSTNMLGAESAYNPTFTGTNANFISNNTTTNSLHHIDIDEFYVYQEISPSMIQDWQFPANEAAGNLQFESGRVLYISPHCPSHTEWQTLLAYFAIVPAPTPTGMEEVGLRTRAGNFKNYEYLYLGGPWGSPYVSATTTGSYIWDASSSTLAPGTFSNWKIQDPKSLCADTLKNHKALYAVDLHNFNFSCNDQTCNSNGSVLIEFTWNYSADWASLGPQTWDIPITFRIYDGATYQYATTNITDTTSFGPISFTYNVNPGSYTLISCAVGPVMSNEYYNANASQVFHNAVGQIESSAYTFDSRTPCVVGVASFTPTPAITITDVTCNGGSDGQITVDVSGAGFAAGNVTIDCTPGAFGSGSLTGSTTSTHTFSSLTTGNHTLIFTDSDGCVFTIIVNVNQPSSLLVCSAVVNQFGTCISASQIVVTDTSGVGVSPYSCVFTDPFGNVGTSTGFSSVTQLMAMPGIWTYIMSDSTGCNSCGGTVTVPVQPSTGLVCITTSINPTTAVALDGQFSIAMDYVPSVFPLGCSLIQGQPNISWTTTASTGLTSGSDLTCGPWPGPGVGPPPGVPITFTGLAPGTITITSTYFGPAHLYNMCTEICTVVLTAPSVLTITAHTAVDDLCSAPANSGEITIDTVTGGSSAGFAYYEYTMCTDAGMSTGCLAPQQNNTFSNLSPGNYYFTVSDWFNPGPIIGQTSAVYGPITIAPPGGPTWTVTANHPTCAGVCDGSFTEVTTGGTAPYLYYFWDSGGSVWMPPGGSTWASLSPHSLCENVILPYTYQVVDAAGCAVEVDMYLVDPPVLTPGTLTATDATCGLNNDGTIALTAWSGGSGAPYTYVLTIFPAAVVLVTQTSTATFTGLAASTYTVTATDSGGCEAPPVTIVVDSTALTLVTSKSDVSCTFPPTNDGSINLTVSGGAPAYTYAWTGPGGPYTTEDLSSLVVGTYVVIVTDSNGCTGTASVDILASADTLENLTLTTVASACPGGCGGIYVDVDGGDFPLYVEISDDGGATFDRVAQSASSPATAFNENAPAPAFGAVGILIDSLNYFKATTANRFCFTSNTNYIFRTLSVANGCYSYDTPITPVIAAYIPMTFDETIVQPDCCSCNNISCAGSINVVINNGVPIAQGAGGSPGTLSFDWTLVHDGINITSVVAYAVSCNGGCTDVEYNELDFTGLYPGTYVFSSTDDCDITVSETWTLIDPRVYITNIVATDQLCANGCDDGTITVTATGGSSGTLQYSIDDGLTWHVSNVFTGVGAGTWRVWARDPMCATQILFDPTDNVLTGANGCYSDYISGLWPTGTSIQVGATSSLDLQHISTIHNSLPGSTDGQIDVNITAGTAPYEISVIASGTSTPFDSCTSQTATTLTAGLNQYININGAPVDVSGITTLAANGPVIIDNLSVAQDYSNTALFAWYRITVKDSTGCFSSIEVEIDNGTLGIIGIYAATNCECACPEGYALITPPPASGLPCAGEVDVAPIDHGPMLTTYSIQQFGSANVYTPVYGTPNGGVLYVDSTSGSASTFVSAADTYYKGAGCGSAFPYNMCFSGTTSVLIPALDSNANVVQYGTIFNTRLLDIGVWLQQGPSVPALPVNTWIGIPIEVDFASNTSCILGISAHGNYRVSIDCALLITSESIGGAQTFAVETNNINEYSMFPFAISSGKHTILIEVKNSTSNVANQPAGLAFDLFQGELSSGLSVTSVFSTATLQSTLDVYHLADVNGKPITSFDKTNANYDHQFRIGTSPSSGYECTSGCVKINGGVITCLSDDTAECDLPINCPEYLSDLVECVGTLSNEVYAKMVAGLLSNNLEIKDIWMVMIMKYLITNLNPCITMQDLLSWTKFLEDICPDCEAATPLPGIDPDQGSPFGGSGTTEYDF